MFDKPNYSTVPAECQIVEQQKALEYRKNIGSAIADLYDLTIYADKYGTAIRNCAEYVIVRKYDRADKLETAYTQYCGARLCPTCAHRRSLKAYWQLSRVLDYIDTERIASHGAPYAYILVTLTMRNIPDTQLAEALQDMTDAYTRLSRSQPWRAAVKGSWRTMEITYNAQDDTYHPHLHVFCAVNPSYFTDKTYLSQATITELWRRSLRAHYTPVVDVRRIKGNRATPEATKYITKSSSVIFDVPMLKGAEVLMYLTDAVAYRKMYITYGVIREAARALHLSDEDGQLLDPTDGDEQLAAELRPEASYVYQLLRYDDQAGQYVTTPQLTYRDIYRRTTPKERLYYGKLAGFRAQQLLDEGEPMERMTQDDLDFIKEAIKPKPAPESEKANTCSIQSRQGQDFDPNNLHFKHWSELIDL